MGSYEYYVKGAFTGVRGQKYPIRNQDGDQIGWATFDEDSGAEGDINLGAPPNHVPGDTFEQKLVVS